MEKKKMGSQLSFEKLLQIEIEKTELHFGDHIFYEMCKPSSAPAGFCAENWLGDKIWLIGRSYAASPERRHGEHNNADDGQGIFFLGIARNLLEDGYFSFFDKIRNLRPYRFDLGEEDFETISKTVEYVDTLNKKMKTAIRQFDQKEDQTEDELNRISFCSKFLHFHRPDVFFIKDQYSFNGGQRIFPRGKLQNRSLIEIPEEESVNQYVFEQEMSADPFLKQLRERFAKHTKEHNEKASTNEKKGIKEYYDHCVRSYLIGCYIKNSGFLLDERISIPRYTDSFFMRIKCCNDKKHD